MQPISSRRAAHCVLAALAWAGGLGLLARWLLDVWGGTSSATSPWGALALALGGVFWLSAGTLHARTARCLAAREVFPLRCAAPAFCGHLGLLVGVVVLFLRGDAGQGFVGTLAWLPPIALTLSPLSMLVLVCDALAARGAPRLCEGALRQQSALSKLSLLTALLGTACCGALLLNERAPRASQQPRPADADAATSQAAPSAAQAP